MEPDRYQTNHALYIFGMVCFLTSMGIFLFTLFTLPHLLFGAQYDVPEFIAFWREYLVAGFDVTEQHASMLISLFFTCGFVIFGLGAYYASSRIDNEIYGLHKKAQSSGDIHFSSETKESLHVFWKIMMLIGLLYGAIFIFLWLLSAPFSFP